MAMNFYRNDSIQNELYFFEVGKSVKKNEVLTVINEEESELFSVSASIEFNVKIPDKAEIDHTIVNIAFTTFLEEKTLIFEENDSKNDSVKRNENEDNEDSMVFRSQAQYIINFTEIATGEQVELVNSSDFRSTMIKDVLSHFKLILNMSLSQTPYESLSLTDKIINKMASSKNLQTDEKG